MTHRGRGSTRAGQPARLPTGHYEARALVGDAGDGLVVHFHGEDGRARLLPVHRLPLPGWHRSLADALAARIGPGGDDKPMHRWAASGQWRAD
jgi:hypothetical protein